VVLNLCATALLVPYFLTRNRASSPAHEAGVGASAAADLEAGISSSRPGRALMHIAAVGAAVIVDLGQTPPSAPAPPVPPRPWPGPDAGVSEPQSVPAPLATPTDSGAAAQAAVPPTTAPPTTTTTAATFRAASRPPPTTTTTTPPQATSPPSTTDTTAAPRNSQTGGASWYDAPAGTCAHRSLPFGTIVTVINEATGASTTCRVADRGPFVAGRIIDLSRDTFAKIASTSSGVIQVRIEW
jgi:rare lipoprotein A